MYCSLEQFCNDPNPNPKNSGRSPNLFLEVQVSGSPELVAGATVCRDHVQLDTTVRNPSRRARPPSVRRRLANSPTRRLSRPGETDEQE
ncbi:hypothetical protein IGI04_041435 [Brassica rapa subsp. trilocularis]|uniref:Uncharacterized protein n=1 Tax=Brassica rapa subsp. trilocularis TaxID=1813537 RepID=A0ABQ7KQT0_BRACM|nr:hypothetical protein IGI04_041435 [Brassica rapa subsp. trilocularis]